MKNKKFELKVRHLRPFICSIPPVFYKSGLFLTVDRDGKETERHSCVIVKEDRAYADPDGYKCVRFWLKCADGETRIFFVCPFSRFDGPGTIIHTDRPGNRQTLCVAC